MALLPSFGNYSKLVNGMIGAAVGMGAAYLVSIVPGIGECVAAPLPDDAAHQACTILGISDTKISEAVITLVTLLFVHQSPPNEPAKPVQ